MKKTERINKETTNKKKKHHNKKNKQKTWENSAFVGATKEGRERRARDQKEGDKSLH